MARVIGDALIIHTRHWRLCIDRDLAAGGPFSVSSSAFPSFSACAGLSSSQLPRRPEKYEECKSMWVDEHLGREMEIKVDEAVLVLH